MSAGTGDPVEAWLPFVFVSLVVVLLVSEGRRRLARRARTLAGTLTAEDRREITAAQEVLPWRESLRRFLRGAPARRLTLHGLWEIWQALLNAVVIVLGVYFIGEEIVADPNARAVVLATIGAIVVVGGLGLLWRRYRARRGV